MRLLRGVYQAVQKVHEVVKFTKWVGCPTSGNLPQHRVFRQPVVLSGDEILRFAQRKISRVGGAKRNPP